MAPAPVATHQISGLPRPKGPAPADSELGLLVVRTALFVALFDVFSPKLLLFRVAGLIAFRHLAFSRIAHLRQDDNPSAQFMAELVSIGPRHTEGMLEPAGHILGKDKVGAGA